MFLFHLGQAGRHRQAAEDAPSLDPRRLDSMRREPLRSGAPLGPQKSQSPPPLAHTCRLVAVALHIHLAGTKKIGRVMSQLLFLDGDKRKVPTQSRSLFKEL